MQSFHLYLYGPDHGPLVSSFEAASERLEQMPRLYLEPDGSFVWTKEGGDEKIFGMMYDARGQLQYVELWGQCSRGIWRELIAALSGTSAGASDDLAVLRLPERQWQNLHHFEESALA